MSRSAWKGYYISKEVRDIARTESKIKGSKPIKIWSRDSVIPDFLTGKKVSIHNGKEFKDLVIQPHHLGYKFGEFSFTRHHGGHKRLKMVQKKNASKASKGTKKKK